MRYYGVPVLSGQVTSDEMAVEICERSSLTEADVIAAIHSLKRLIQEYLSYGKSVRLEGIGTFYVSASSKACETPEECTPAKVKAQRVCFTADRELRSVLPKIKYRKVNRGRKSR